MAMVGVKMQHTLTLNPSREPNKVTNQRRANKHTLLIFKDKTNMHRTKTIIILL